MKSKDIVIDMLSFAYGEMVKGKGFTIKFLVQHLQNKKGYTNENNEVEYIVDKYSDKYFEPINKTDKRVLNPEGYFDYLQYLDMRNATITAENSMKVAEKSINKAQSSINIAIASIIISALIGIVSIIKSNNPITLNQDQLNGLQKELIFMDSTISRIERIQNTININMGSVKTKLDTIENLKWKSK